MIDLSNNNVEQVSFVRLRAAGQRRVYLKLDEGDYFVDGRHNDFRARAIAAGLLVGEYHFARPSRCTPRESADHFLRLLPTLTPAHSLRPCLDLEDPNATPGPKVAAWAESWIGLVRRELGHPVVVYGSPGYLGPCGFKTPPGPLWLASYGRNDGHEHAYIVPKPWTHAAAHQFASVGRMAGVAGTVDVSHVLKPRELDIARFTLRRR